MPYETEAKAVRVTAGVDVRHGAPAADNGFVGRAVKTAIPAADGLRASRDLIVAGEAYNLRTKGIMEVPNANLPGIAKGALVYIDPDDNVIGPAQAGNNVVLGKVTHLPSEQGTPSNMVRVDLEQKA
jgi:predicted RecA/RadA family phage recombinase